MDALIYERARKYKRSLVFPYPHQEGDGANAATQGNAAPEYLCGPAGAAGRGG